MKIKVCNQHLIGLGSPSPSTFMLQGDDIMVMNISTVCQHSSVRHVAMDSHQPCSLH
jgi:hypothetical protein